MINLEWLSVWEASLCVHTYYKQYLPVNPVYEFFHHNDCLDHKSLLHQFAITCHLPNDSLIRLQSQDALYPDKLLFQPEMQLSMLDKVFDKASLARDFSRLHLALIA